jgi:hypothetical protein
MGEAHTRLNCGRRLRVTYTVNNIFELIDTHLDRSIVPNILLECPPQNVNFNDQSTMHDICIGNNIYNIQRLFPNHNYRIDNTLDIRFNYTSIVYYNNNFILPFIFNTFNHLELINILDPENLTKLHVEYYALIHQRFNIDYLNLMLTPIRQEVRRILTLVENNFHILFTISNIYFNNNNVDLDDIYERIKFIIHSPLDIILIETIYMSGQGTLNILYTGFEHSRNIENFMLNTQEWTVIYNQPDDCIVSQNCIKFRFNDFTQGIKNLYEVWDGRPSSMDTGFGKRSKRYPSPAGRLPQAKRSKRYPSPAGRMPRAKRSKRSPSPAWRLPQANKK